MQHMLADQAQRYVITGDPCGIRVARDLTGAFIASHQEQRGHWQVTHNTVHQFHVGSFAEAELVLATIAAAVTG